MKRFIFSNNGTLSDQTTSLSDYHQGTFVIDYTQNEDAIYIGSSLPFNSVFISVSTPNAIASPPSVALWNGDSWKNAVDVIDETNGLFNSGYLTWTPNKDEVWHMEDSEDIPELSTLTIYDLYWIKITLSATITPTTALNWIGQKFCSDNDLTNEYTLFSNSTFRGNYKAGKTSWENEIIIASRLMVEDIKKRRAIESGEQLLVRSMLLDACVAKTAQLIFKNLGDDYKDDAENAKKEYYERINKANFGSDKNNDGRLDPSEKRVVANVLYQ